jgi:hypothetical protein
MKKLLYILLISSNLFAQQNANQLPTGSAGNDGEKHLDKLFADSINVSYVRAGSIQGWGGNNIIAMSPVNAPAESIVTFDGMQIKWSQNINGAGGWDGLLISTISGTRDITYSSNESYVGSSQFDAGANMWGSQNYYYTTALAVSNNTTFPHNKTISTTWIIIGNNGMFQHNIRKVYLTDVTNNNRYVITAVKKASTGETGNQTGSCDIWVEKIGITTNAITTPVNRLIIRRNGATSGGVYTTGTPRNVTFPTVNVDNATNSTTNGFTAPTSYEVKATFANTWAAGAGQFEVQFLVNGFEYSKSQTFTSTSGIFITSHSDVIVLSSGDVITFRTNISGSITNPQVNAGQFSAVFINPTY